MRLKYLTFLCILLLQLIIAYPIHSQEVIEEERKGIPPIPATEIPEITDEELLEIIDRSDLFFFNQDIENLAVDMKLFRDPSRQISLQDMKTGKVDEIATLSPIFAHYFYEAPGWYQLKVMGFVVATSENDDLTSFTSLLPLPGGQLNIAEVTDAYDLTYLGYGEVNDRETHRVRFSAKNFGEEFIRYSVYDFDIEEGYLSRVESHFDNGYYVGHGFGEFYYTERKGRLLPAYGYGEIFIQPYFRIILWGRWFNWDFNSEEFGGSLKPGEEEEQEAIDVDKS